MAQSDFPHVGPGDLWGQKLIDSIETRTDDSAFAEKLAGPKAAAVLSGTIESQNQVQVPPLVAAAIASDPTIAGAAANAVTEAVADLNILEGEIWEVEDYFRAWADTNGRMAIGIKKTGVVHIPLLETTSIPGSGTEPTPAPAAITPTVLMPSEVEMLAGVEHFHYYDQFVAALSVDNKMLLVDSSLAGLKGRYKDRWQPTPVAGVINSTFGVHDLTGKEIARKPVKLTTRAKTGGTGVRHMAIGDSITANGEYVRGAVITHLGGKTVGTKTKDNGILSHEGRSGWTLEQYMTQIGHASFGDSPFLFPAGVSGNKFIGNTEFWKTVVTDPAYEQGAFQKIAKGWAGADFLYGTNGYPLAPTEGDVVVDPLQAAGAKYRQYTGGAWAAMNPQPAIEFSFTKYMQRYAAAFPNGGPTTVSIMLGTNDFHYDALESRLNQHIIWLGQMMASIRAWQAGTPVLLMIPLTGGPEEAWKDRNVHKWLFDHRMQACAKRILAEYDNATARSGKTFIVPFTGAVAEANIQDHVHPSPTGHAQMAPWLAASILRAIGA